MRHLELSNKKWDCTSITRTGADSLKAVYITEDGGTDTATFGGIEDMTQFKITGDDGSEYTAADLPIERDPLSPYQQRADIDYIAMMTEVQL